MNQRIFSSIMLVVIGILIGLFVLISYQFHRRLQTVENYVLNNGQRIIAVEEFINDNLIKPADNNKANQ